MIRKTKAVSKISPVTSGEKISIPGVILSDLFELQEIFPNIRQNLAIIILPVLIVAQIRLACGPEVKSAAVQGLPSVNSYNRLFLAKSEPLLYVTAAVAIRKTMSTYALQDDDDISPIVRDHNDLTTNLSGSIITRGGIGSAIGDPERVRSYRRGLMAQTTGLFQSTPIHSPRRLCRDIENITPENYLSRLPFPTDDIDKDYIFGLLNLYLSPSKEPKVFIDFPSVPKGKVPLELLLNISRATPTLPDISSLPADTSKLPAWKASAIKQARNLSGGY